MQPFTFYTPTKISFGEDTTCGIADALSDMGAKKPLVVTDANLIKAGVLQPVLDALAYAGHKDILIFDEVPADSDLGSVRKAADAARRNGCDSVIAVGGGSVLDTAKVANIGLTFDGDVLEFEGMNTLSSKCLPLVAVPTTAGTGSEVSAVAMIKDHEEHKKLLFGSRFLFPDVAILDPKLLVSLPPKLTAATGLDALTHAIESYTAMTTNSPSEALCLEAMRLLFINLPRATINGADIEARSATLVGSMMAGVSFTNAGVGIVHALAHSIGAKYGTHHGVTNAIFLPLGMEFNIVEAGDKYQRAYRYLNTSRRDFDEPVRELFSVDVGGDEAAAANQLTKAVRALTVLCGLPTRLGQIGVPQLSEADLEEIAEMAMTDPAMMFNPRMATSEEVVQLLKGAY